MARVTFEIAHSYMNGKWGFIVYIDKEPVVWVPCKYETREEAEEAAQAACVETGVMA